MRRVDSTRVGHQAINPQFCVGILQNFEWIKLFGEISICTLHLTLWVTQCEERGCTPYIYRHGALTPHVTLRVPVASFFAKKCLPT